MGCVKNRRWPPSTPTPLPPCPHLTAVPCSVLTKCYSIVPIASPDIFDSAVQLSRQTLNICAFEANIYQQPNSSEQHVSNWNSVGFFSALLRNLRSRDRESAELRKIWERKFTVNGSVHCLWVLLTWRQKLQLIQPETQTEGHQWTTASIQFLQPLNNISQCISIIQHIAIFSPCCLSLIYEWQILIFKRWTFTHHFSTWTLNVFSDTDIIIYLLQYIGYCRVTVLWYYRDHGKCIAMLLYREIPGDMPVKVSDFAGSWAI